MKKDTINEHSKLLLLNPLLDEINILRVVINLTIPC